MKLKFSLTRDVHPPTRAHQKDAGIDFWVPRDFNSRKTFILQPHERILIPSGVYVNIPDGRCLIGFNKSGIGSKLGLDILACVVGDTIIETNKGKFTAKTLTKDFINKNNILIKGYDKNECGYFEFDGFRNSGKKNTIKLIFENNIELICSDDHLILTTKGWIVACNIDETYEIICV